MREREQSSGKRTQFLQDQRGPRNMIIGCIDQMRHSKWRIAKRKEPISNELKKQKTDGDANKSQTDSAESMEDESDSSDSATVDEYIPDSIKTKPKPERQCQKMTISLPSSLKLVIEPESPIDQLLS